MHSECDHSLEEHQDAEETIKINLYAILVLNDIRRDIVQIYHCEAGMVDAFWEWRWRMKFV